MPEFGTRSFFEATAAPRPERRPLGIDVDCEIAVIGGGVAGLSVAHALACRGRDVAVFEAERIGDGASGHNAGYVAPGFALSSGALLSRVGEARAKELWQLSATGVEAVRQFVSTAELPGIDVCDGRLVAFTTVGEDVAERVAERWSRWGTRAEFWPRARVGEVLSSRRFHAAIHLPDAFSVHPLNYLTALAQAVDAAGGRVFEQTPVTGGDFDGVRKTIETPRARVRASEIVFCGSWQIGAACPPLRDTIRPIIGHFGVTAPLGERVLQAIRFGGVISDTRRLSRSHRLIGDRLLWSGGVSAGFRPMPRLLRRLSAEIGGTYPQLANMPLEYAWAAVAGRAAHNMPQIGQLGRGLWAATAFGENGLAMSATTGALIASAILDGDERWRLFSSFGLVPIAGRLTRAGFKVAHWVKRAQDRLDEALLDRERRDDGKGQGSAAG